MAIALDDVIKSLPQEEQRLIAIQSQTLIRKELIRRTLSRPYKFLTGIASPVEHMDRRRSLNFKKI